MDVFDEVFRCAEECLEGRLAFAPTEKVTVWCDDHFGQLGRSPVLLKQTAQDRLEMVADLDRPELACAILSNLGRITDGKVVGGHYVVMHVKTGHGCAYDPAGVWLNNPLLCYAWQASVDS